MTYTQEKIFFGISSLFSSTLAWTGALLSTGDTRWLLITIAIGSMTSALLSLIFRQPHETMQLTCARSGFSILGSIFLTKYVAWQTGIDSVHTDPINLGGLTFLVCIVVFCVGFKALRYLEKKSDYIARKFIDSKIASTFPFQEGKNESQNTDAEK